MMDVVRRFRRIGHMHRAHPECVGCGEVARLVFEHRGPRRFQSVRRKYRGKGPMVGLGMEIRVFDAIDGIKKRVETARGQHPFGIGPASVGVYDPPSWQRTDAVGKDRVRFKRMQRDIMHIRQIWRGIDVMFPHQPCKRCAMGPPVVNAQTVRLGLVHAKGVHHVLRHPHFDLIKEPGGRGIERVVEVKDPRVDMGKGGREVRHAPRDTGDAAPRQGQRVAQMGLGSIRYGNPMIFRGLTMPSERPPNTDAYSLILEAIDVGVYKPGDRLVESELAERFGVSRTPIREALQRLETQSLLSRDGRSLIVASLDHNQMAELYIVRRELEGLAASLAARHATEEEIRLLRQMVEDDNKLIDDPAALARANRRFHKQIHLASHNRYLVQQLDLVHRTMALMATTSLAAAGRTKIAQSEHDTIVKAIEAHDEKAAGEALRDHISVAFMTRLKQDADTRQEEA